MRLPFLIFFNYRTLAKVILFIIPVAILVRVYWPAPPVEITFTALRWDAKLDIIDQQEKDIIIEAMRYMHKMRQPGPPKQLALYSMTITEHEQQRVYLITETGEFFCPEGVAVLPSYKLREIAKHYIGRLERQSPYGQLISWPEARQIFSRYNKATVEDLDTGLRFNVQRRAGNLHADVQPLTADDTAIMKEIYDDGWSWRRRAIIVEVGNQRLAASMNGMPHGAGAIKHNNFNGHFCIHFKGSATHQNPTHPNLAHQIMVWKAAGRLPEQLALVGPEELVDIFFTALGQRATDVCRQILAGEPTLDNWGFMDNIKDVNELYYDIVTYDTQTNTAQVQVQINYGNEKNIIKQELQVQMLYSHGFWWKIDPRSINQLFMQKSNATFNNLPPQQVECL